MGFLQYVSNDKNTFVDGSFPVAAVAGGAGGGGVLVLVVVVVIVIISVVVYGRSSRRKNAQVASLLMQMESMESAMADECKRGVCPLRSLVCGCTLIGGGVCVPKCRYCTKYSCCGAMHRA